MTSHGGSTIRRVRFLLPRSESGFQPASDTGRQSEPDQLPSRRGRDRSSSRCRRPRSHSCSRSRLSARNPRRRRHGSAYCHNSYSRSRLRLDPSPSSSPSSSSSTSSSSSYSTSPSSPSPSPPLSLSPSPSPVLLLPSSPAASPHPRTIQPAKISPWILRADTNTHKCADLHLFRAPFTGQGVGIAVIPILPGPRHWFDFDISVMTLSPTVHTPGAEYSELSWPVLARQGFTKHDAVDAASTAAVAIRSGSRQRASWPQAHRGVSIIRHPNLPGIDILWCGFDNNMGPLTRVHNAAIEMVDVEMWSAGVRLGIVGRSADMYNAVQLDMEPDELFENFVQRGRWA